MDYNLMAEVSALLIGTIILISFKRDYEEKSLQFKMLKYMYYGTIISIVATITSTMLTDVYPPFFSVEISYIITLIYFITVPIGAYFYLLYAISITKFCVNKNKKTRRKVYIIASIPYGIYSLLILSTIFNDKVFIITQEGEYIREAWYQMPYLMAGIHLVITLLVTIKTIHKIYKEAILILSVNLFLVAGITSIQFFIDDVYMAGLAGISGVLVVHLYVQNKDKATDKLTEIKNRKACMLSIDGHIKKNKSFSLYVVSVRNFKSINAKLGFDYGDDLLKEMAFVLVEIFSIKEVFRYGGDEFVILPKTGEEGTAEKIKEVIERFENGIEVRNVKHSVETICARVDYPEFGTNTKELISAADYSIKSLKESTAQRKYIHDRGSLLKMKEKSEMGQRLKDAIKYDSFEVHYQPIYNMKEEAFTQAEALVRMKKEDGTLIYPGEFIELAEKNGSIVELTYIVIEKTCADLRKILNKHGDEAKVKSMSVNFSYLQFLDEQVIDKTMDILKKYYIEPWMIKIEITERIFVEDISRTNKIIEKMKEKGFVFELDDFGIDYSSMNMIFDIPAEIVKIDKAILELASRSKENSIFFKNLIVGMMKAGKRIVIEGAETMEHLAFIKECRCEFVQGYIFSEPKGFEAFEKFLIENSTVSYASKILKEI